MKNLVNNQWKLGAMAVGLFLSGCATQGTPMMAQEQAAPVSVHTATPAPVEHQSVHFNATQSKKVDIAAQKAEVNIVSHTVKVKKKKLDLIKVTGVGYGSESTYEGYTPGQRRLMAIRASKLDAYRSLAEQINGIKIDSNTAIATLTAQSDSFRARVNAVVRGARVISITPMADHNYETVLEVYVDRDFFRKNFVYTAKDVAEDDDVMTIGELCNSGACH